jgi:dipeptidyl aminopeptidase/acylaminoacyl peptidase
MRIRSLGMTGLLALSLAVDSSSAPAKAEFAIADVLSSPFPAYLVASPRRGLVAWVFEEKGTRNVWVADLAAKGKAQKLTAYAGDDGTDLGELAWDPSGRFVVYSRGGSLEGGGGPVNIMSLPEGPPKQEIWTVPVDGGEPKLVGEGHTPAVAPKGDLVAYISGDQIWVATVSGEQKPSQLIHDRGRCQSIVWSNDGSRLAFVSLRGDYSFVGVYDFSRKSLVWLAPSVDEDTSPAWSPDGRQIAFIRIPSAKPGPSVFANPEGEPWSIWVADTATGTGHKIWAADRGWGSVFHGLLSATQLFWTAADRLVFPWEKTGWLRLYTLPSAGGQSELLTPGSSEIFNAAFDPAGTRIVYSSNQEGDTDRVHLWEVSTAGGAPRQITTGLGIEDNPVIASVGTIAMLHSDARNPLQPGALNRDGKIDELASGQIPFEFPRLRLVVPQSVVFTSPDGMKIHGQLFVPAKKNLARGAAVLFFHGGPRREMFLGWHPMHAYHYLYGMNQYLASKGYVVLSVNYRGGTGYGLQFREPPNFSASGGAELNDILGAIQFLRARSDIDPKRIGIYGGSYGGLMTALGLARASDALAAGVDIAGVHNWKSFMPFLTAPGADPGLAQIAYNSSPIATVDRWRSPVMFIHADDDRNVPISQTVELVQAMRDQGNTDFELVIIPDEIHVFLRHQTWITVFGAMDEFLSRRLPPNK